MIKVKAASFGSFENVELEKTKCPVCSIASGTPAGSVSSHGATFNYILCDKCGLKYMNPRSSAAWYQAHYQNFFWEYKVENRSWRDSAKKWRLRDLFKRGNSGRMKVQQKRVSQLIPQLEENSSLSSGKLMLDIGCAYGAIGKHLIDHFDCELWGVEPNETAREIAVKKMA